MKVLFVLIGIVALNSFAMYWHLVNTADTVAAAFGEVVSIVLIPCLVGTASGLLGAWIAGGGASGLKAFWWFVLLGEASALAPVAISIWAMSRVGA